MSNAKIIKLETDFPIKPYTKGQLVKLYRPISLYVLNKWLAAIEEKTGPIISNTISPRQLIVFVEEYGPPGIIVQQQAA